MQTQNPLVHIHTSPLSVSSPHFFVLSLSTSLTSPLSSSPFPLSFPSSSLPSLTTFHLLLYSVFPLLRFPSFSALRNMALALQSKPPNEEIVPLWRSTITCPFNSAHVFKNAHRHSAHTHVCYSAVWKRGIWFASRPRLLHCQGSPRSTVLLLFLIFTIGILHSQSFSADWEKARWKGNVWG